MLIVTLVYGFMFSTLVRHSLFLLFNLRLLQFFFVLYLAGTNKGGSITFTEELGDAYQGKVIGSLPVWVQGGER